MRKMQAGAMQPAHTGDFLLRVRDLIRIDRLLRLEDGVDAFGGDDRLALEREDEGRILAVEYDHVDLLAEYAVAIDNVGRRGLVALGQIGLQGFQPDRLAGVPLRYGVAEALADDFQLLLDVVVPSRAQDRKRPLRHAAPS